MDPNDFGVLSRCILLTIANNLRLQRDSDDNSAHLEVLFCILDVQPSVAMDGQHVPATQNKFRHPGYVSSQSTKIAFNAGQGET